MKKYSHQEEDECSAGELYETNSYSDGGLPDPSLLQYYILLQERIILWNEEISEMILDVSMMIQMWNLDDKDLPVENRVPIKIYINSNGGDVDSVLHLADIIQLSKTPVITIGMGKVFSAGCLLLMAGHKRYVFEHTCCLIHDGSFGTANNMAKVLDCLEFTKKLEDHIRTYVLRYTKIRSSDYDKNYRRDWFMFSDDMIRYGIADEIVQDMDDIL